MPVHSPVRHTLRTGLAVAALLAAGGTMVSAVGAAAETLAVAGPAAGTPTRTGPVPGTQASLPSPTFQDAVDPTYADDLPETEDSGAVQDPPSRPLVYGLIGAAGASTLLGVVLMLVARRRMR